jgi:mRNA interferase MazF
MICERWDVVIVAFPFADLPVLKGRPAVVLSSEQFNRSSSQSILAMITRARESRWTTDVAIQNLQSAGLRAKSMVRLKLVTAINDQISRRIGILAEGDQASVLAQLRAILP